MPRDDPLDILDPDALRLAGADEMGEQFVHPFERQARLEGEPEDDLVEGPFQLTARRGDGIRDMFENLVGDLEAAG